MPPRRVLINTVIVCGAAALLYGAMYAWLPRGASGISLMRAAETFHQCSRDAPQAVDGFWMPTASQMTPRRMSRVRDGRFLVTSFVRASRTSGGKSWPLSYFEETSVNAVMEKAEEEETKAEAPVEVPVANKQHQKKAHPEKKVQQKGGKRARSATVASN